MASATKQAAIHSAFAHSAKTRKKRRCRIFRYKKSVRLKAERQMYIYAVSRLYKELSERNRKTIRELCNECGAEYSAALFEFVTTDTTATALEFKYHLSKPTLYRIVKKYYERFPEEM